MNILLSWVALRNGTMCQIIHRTVVNKKRITSTETIENYKICLVLRKNNNMNLSKRSHKRYDRFNKIWFANSQ